MEASITYRASKRRWTKYQKAILIILILFTAAAWAYTIASTGGMDGMVMDMGANDPAMEQAMAARNAESSAPPEFSMFVPMWITMCVAMMLPSAIPMVTAYQALLHNKYKKQGKEAHAYVTIFVAGYILLWAMFGVACWAIAALIYSAVGEWLSISSHSMILSGLLFILCGAFQLSRLKEACLKGCRHPVMFLIRHWRDGYGGAFRVAVTHGWICVACCWALMVVLFPLGYMNLAWMGLFTIIMYVEKNVRIGALVSKIVGALIIAAGVATSLLGVVFL